jgi:hypothetical protein
MEPTLHCAKPVEYCEGRFSDRVIANRLAYRFRDPTAETSSCSKHRQRPTDVS